MVTAMATPSLIRPEMVAGYRDHRDVVTAELVGDHPDWVGFRALLIRPDGTSPGRSPATRRAGPLAALLGDPRG
jgi:hypothetical protein